MIFSWQSQHQTWLCWQSLPATFQFSSPHDWPMQTDVRIFVFRHTCRFPRADVWITALTVCAVIPTSLSQQSCYLFSEWVSKSRAKAKKQSAMAICQVFLDKPHFFFESSSTAHYTLWNTNQWQARFWFISVNWWRISPQWAMALPTSTDINLVWNVVKQP